MSGHALALPRLRARRRRRRLRRPDPSDLLVMLQALVCVVMGGWAFGYGAVVAGCLAFAMAGSLVRLLVAGWGRRWTAVELRDYAATCMASTVVAVLALLRI